MADAQPLTTPVAAAPEAVIQAMLDREKAPPAPQPDKAAAAPAAAPQEQVPAQTDATPEQEAPAGPNTQTEGDDVPAADARQVAEIPLDQLEAIELDVTIKGEDGKDIAEKQSIKALREGYMRQKDYQRKTAEVARQRDAVGEQVRQAVESERTAYQQSLQQMQDLLVQTVAPELKDVNWNDLAANNAFEYVRLRNRADQIAQALSTVQAKQKELTDKQAKEQDASRQTLAAKAREELQRDIPSWNDGLYQTLMKSSESYGFKPEEVATWVDARAIKLLHKAYQFDQLQAEKTAPSPAKKVVTYPTTVRPGTVSNLNQRQQQGQVAMQRLQKSGGIDDAAAVIRSRLK